MSGSRLRKMPPSESSVAASPKSPLWLRWLGLGAGFLTLTWLPVEDSRITLISVLSIIWALWTAGWILSRPRWSGWAASSSPRQIALSGAIGLTVYPIALTLNVLKTGLHGHGFPDLSLFQLRWVFFLTPLWIILAGIFGWILTSQNLHQGD